MDGGAAMTEAAVVVGGTRYPVPSQGLRVGRAPDNDVVIQDPNVSRQHLVVWTTPHGAFLRDLGSQNGTYIGQRRIGAKPEELASGTRVRVGHTELVLELRAVPIRREAAPSNRVGLILGGITLVLMGLMIVTGIVVYRAVAPPSTVEATPAPVAASTGATPTAPPASRNATAVPPQPAQPSAPTVPLPVVGRDPGLVRALTGSVRILVPTGPNQGNTGSGTIVTSRGHILTNFHVVSDDQQRLINQGNGIIIAVPPSEGEPAQPKYLAKVVDGDPKLDFALLRIVSLTNSRPLPPELGLTPIPVGNSDEVRIGDTMLIVGYPGLGGASITVTRGIHSGVQTFRDEPGTYFKTDTEISPGSSGGTAINGAGELVGVPTAGRFNRETVGKLGLIRPINLARPLIEKANQDR
jgi:S1-C subfamily serine protease